MQITAVRAAALIAIALVCHRLPASANAAEPADSVRLPVAYKLARPGQVSAAIYDSQGRMVRPLLYGDKQEAGEHTLTWDGLDRNGEALPPGEYEWRLLRTPGFTREFLVNLGTNISWGKYGYWPGNHAGPTALTVDGEGNLYVGSVSTEGPPPIVKLAPDGSKLLGTTGTWGFRQGLVRLAATVSAVYALCEGGNLILVGDSRPRPGSHLAEGVNTLFEGGPIAKVLHKDDDPKKVKFGDMHLAGGKDLLVVCYLQHDEVRLLWPKDRKLDKEVTISVAKPVSAAVAPDGRVFVASPGRIAILDVEKRMAKTLVEDANLTSPGSLAYDPTHDDLILANGAHLRRYHAPDGKPVAVYGRTDGKRTYGLYNPLEFGPISDVAADGKGGFFVLEHTPRRVAHFRGREKHEFVRQWFGGMGWGWQAILDPQDPTIAYFGVDYQHFGRAKVDSATASWALTHLYEVPEWFGWNANNFEKKRDIFPGPGDGWTVRHAGGQTFLVHRTNGVSVVRVDDKENRLVPVARLGMLHPTLDRENPPAWWLAACQRAGFKVQPKLPDYKHFSYSWTDTKRKGRLDTQDIQVASVGLRGMSACFIDAKWNVYLAANDGRGDARPLWVMVPNEGKEDDLPIWNWDHAKTEPAALSKTEAGSLSGFNPSDIFVGADGAKYLVAEAGKHSEAFPISWPNNVNAVSRFLKWDSKGRHEFSVGTHTALKTGLPGRFANIRAVVGEVRGNLVVRDACSPATVWTADGLYAGTFYAVTYHPDVEVAVKDLRPAMSDDPQDGQVFQTPDGKVIWGANDANNTPVYRIDGWDGWDRQSGKLILKTTPAAARFRGEGLRAEYFASADLTGEPALKRLDPTIWFGPQWGDHRHIPATYNWFDKGSPLAAGKGSARWTGFLEAPLSEDFVFHVLAYGQTTRGRQDEKEIGAKVRLWVDGKKVIDSWDKVAPGKVDGYVRTRWLKSAPQALTAGARVPIKLEYSADGGDEAHLHLYWESHSNDLRHIPKALLYP